MGRIRGSNKTCTECYEQFTGTKCYCSMNFTQKKSNKKSPNKEVKIRRTERVKRGRPDYYDVLEYERHTRKERKPRAKSKILFKQKSEKSKPDTTSTNATTTFKSNRMHLKTKKIKKKKVEMEEAPKEEELEEIVLSKETIAKFDLILQEINKKIYASSWRVYID